MSRTASRSPATRSRPGYSGPNDEQGRPHGMGVQRYQDGSRYEGDFVHGAIHGRGVYRYASGARYVGRFTDGLRGPKGTYTFACGTTYDGEYANDTRTGSGTMTFSATAGASIRAQRRGAACPVLGPQTAHAVKFTGTFANGRMHGSGTLTFAAPVSVASSVASASLSDSLGGAGATYTGALENDLEQGHGVLVLNKHATRIEGTFAQGAPVGRCVVLHVKSGERATLAFDEATGLVAAQTCVADVAGNGEPCDAAKQPTGRCSACGAIRRDDLAEWLLPPEHFSARARPASAVGRPPSAAGRRGGQGLPAAATAQFSSDDDDDGAGDEVIDLDNASDSGDAAATPEPQPKRTASARPTSAKPRAPPGRSSSSSHEIPADAKERLMALEDRVVELLREARPGLGMAIADCLVKPRKKHDGGHHYHQHIGGQQPTQLRVVQVAPNSAASRAGIARGDFILAVDGSAVTRREEFAAMPLSAGDLVKVTIRRRRPMVARLANESSGTAASSVSGAPEDVVMTVGCTVDAASVIALERIRTAAAGALAAVEGLTISGSSEPPTARQLAEWEGTVNAIRPTRFPEAWDASTRSSSHAGGTPKAPPRAEL